VKGDPFYSFYTGIRPTLRRTFDKYHLAKGNLALIDKYDFSFCQEEGKETDTVTNEDFKKYFLRELVIDTFFDNRENNDAPVHDSVEGLEIRRLARKCINALEQTASPTCDGIKLEFWQEIRTSYMDALDPISEMNIVAQYATDSIFETTNGNISSLSIKGVVNKLAFTIEPEKALDLDSRFQFFLKGDSEKGPKAKATAMAARVAWIANRLAYYSKKGIKFAGNILAKELGKGLLWLGRHAYSSFKQVVRYISPTLENFEIVGDLFGFTVDLGPSPMIKDIRSIVRQITTYFHVPDRVINVGNLRYGRSYIRGIDVGLSPFQRDIRAFKRGIQSLGNLLTDPRRLAKTTWRGVKRTAYRSWKYIKKTGEKAYSAVTNYDNWKRGFKALTSLDTYKNFIKANPDLVVSLSMSLGIYIGAQYNKPENHFELWNTDLGFGMYGAIGGTLGFAGGLAIVALAGGPVTLMGAVGILAFSAANWVVWTALDKFMGSQLKTSTESDEDYAARIHAASEEAIFRWSQTANAADLRKFTKGGTKLSDMYQQVHRTIVQRIQRKYDSGDPEFKSFLDTLKAKQKNYRSGNKVFLENGKTIHDKYYENLTDTELNELFRLLLQPIKKSASGTTSSTGPANQSLKGGAQEIYRTTPLFDFFDTILLFMTMNNVRYLRDGYTEEQVQDLTLLEYLSAVMPLCRDLLSIDYRTENVHENLLLAIELPFSFLSFEPAIGLSVPSLVEGLYDGLYRTEKLSEEQLQDLLEHPRIFTDPPQEKESPV
jgi:hypothetical protein